MGYRVATPEPEQFIDASGNPIVGGTIEFYVTGTTTPATVYADSAGTPLGTSVTLNARGEPQTSGGTAVNIYYDESVTYKRIRKDADGVPVAPTQDPFTVGVSRTETIIRAATVATMKALGPLSAGMLCQTIEHTTGYGYQGGNLYISRAVTAATDDNGAVIKSTGDTDFEWVGMFPNGVNIRQFGASPSASAADNTTAINNAATYSIKIIWPAGTYTTNAALQLGDGRAREWEGENRYTTVLENAASNVVNVGNTNDASFFKVTGMTIKSTSGGGHVFNVVDPTGTSMFKLSDCKIQQDNPAKSLWEQTVGYSGGGIVENCHLVAASTGTMTVHPWNFKSNQVVNGWKFSNLRCDHSRGVYPFFRVDTTNASSFITNMSFDNITFELTYGGMIWLGGCRSVEINNCASYDMAGTQTGHGIRIGASTGGQNSSRCKVKHVGRYQISGGLAGNIYDILLESGQAANCIIESCFNSSAGNVFTVDYGNNKTLHIDRPSNSESSYSNADNVRYIDINGDYEGFVAPAYHTKIGTSGSTLTIASGAITPTHLYHTVDTQAAAASDDLDTITATYVNEGDELILRAANSARTVVVKNGTGNINLAGSDFSLDNGNDIIKLVYTGSAWCEVARANNGA